MTRPFDSPWTVAGNEFEVMCDWLRLSVPTMRVRHVRGHEPTIVDFNVCCVSETLLVELVRLGRRPIYTVVDNDPGFDTELLDRLGPVRADVDIRPFHGQLETFVPGGFDLAVVNGVLPYTASLFDAVHRVVDRARSALFVQPGERGLRTIRQQFGHLFGDHPNLLTTGEHVVNALQQIDLRSHDVRQARLKCHVNVSSCLDPESEQGRELLAFIFNQTYEELAPDTLMAVRSFLRDTYAGDNYMVTHDIDIVYIS